MKNLLVLTACVGFTVAQSIGDLPTCSLSCLTTAISTLGCEPTDFACSCGKASELYPVITPCVQAACSDPADQSKTVKVLAGICAAAGFPIETPEASSSEAPAKPTTILPTTVEATHAPSSEALLETQTSTKEEPEYSGYPVLLPTTSEFVGEFCSPIFLYISSS